MTAARMRWVSYGLMVLFAFCAIATVHAQDSAADPPNDTRIDTRLGLPESPATADEDVTDAAPRVGDDGLTGMLAHAQSLPRKTLLLTWAAETGYDTNIYASISQGVTDTGVAGSWRSAGATVRRAGQWRHATMTFGASAKGRFYPEVTNLTGVDADADIALAAPWGRKRTFLLMERVRYKPYYDLQLSRTTPFDDVISRSTAGMLSGRRSFSNEGRVGLTQTLGRKTTLSADYDYRQTRIANVQDASYWHMADVTMARKLSRYSALRLGYGLGTSRDAVQSRVAATTLQNINVGIDYARRLSQLERTSVNFSSGSTLVDDVGVRRYYVLLDGGLRREIGRTWSSNVAYHQGVSFVDGIPGPLYGRTVSARLGGGVSTRVRLSLQGDYGRGEAGRLLYASTYSTRSVAGDVSAVILPRLSLVARYDYYHYGFDEQAKLPFAIGSLVNRQTVQIGLSGTF